MSTEQNTMATMVRSFAEIIERMVQRHDDQGAEHERKLAEHRASFGARTSADAKIIDGMRAEVEDLRSRLNALGIQAAKQAECDAQVRDILGAAKGEESVDAAKRVVVDLAEWKRGQASWKNDATTQRQETAENQRKLLDILNAGTVDPSWQRCLDYAEARMANARKFEEDVNEALGIHPEQSPHSALQRAKWLKKQDKYQTEKLAEILGYKSDVAKT